MEITIQKASLSQLPAIIQLLKLNNLPFEDLQQQMLDHFLVAKNDQEVVGVVGLEVYEQVALLRSLVVSRHFRGMEVGKRLMESVEKVEKSLQLQQVFLLTTDAERYFKPFGYQVVHRSGVPESIQQTSEFSDLCPASAKVMVKTIP